MRLFVLRRCLALTLLTTVAGSMTESEVGVLRDGRVHHETPMAAAAHRAAEHSGEHGHEHPADTPQHRHGEGHQHGTSADHCTHAHGIPLIAVFDVVLAEAVSRYEVDEPELHLQRLQNLEFHPPRS